MREKEKEGARGRESPPGRPKPSTVRRRDQFFEILLYTPKHMVHMEGRCKTCAQNTRQEKLIMINFH